MRMTILLVHSCENHQRAVVWSINLASRETESIPGIDIILDFEQILLNPFSRRAFLVCVNSFVSHHRQQHHLSEE
jgi:hypothetical protein